MTVTRHVFVYGSLRPDDDSGLSWTEESVRGLTAQPARLPKARLFLSQQGYACVVLDPSYERRDSVLGYVLSASDDEFWREKLQLFDQIEGYKGPGSRNLYDRTVVDVDLISSDGNERPSQSVKAYVYHGTHNCDRQHPIPSGHWLRRDLKDRCKLRK